MAGRRHGKWNQEEELESKQQIRSECGIGQADAGRDGRTCLAGSNSQAQIRTGKKIFFLFSRP